MKKRGLCAVALGLCGVALAAWIWVWPNDREQPARLDSREGVSAGQWIPPEDEPARPSAVLPPARNPSQPAPSLDPALAAMAQHLEHIDEELSRQFNPTAELPPSAKRTPDPTGLPALDQGRAPAGRLDEAVRWFEGLPKTTPTSKAALTARRARMSKVGLELITSECRSGVCRLSFAYSGYAAEDIARELDGRDQARTRSGWWSFTIFRPDGRVEGHVFMVGGNSHGGTK